MTQFLSQSFSQQMRLEQRLTPQLIQSMSILQKPVAELEAFINDALESNAALEITEPQGENLQAFDGENHKFPKPVTDEEQRLRWLDRYTRTYDLDRDERAPHSAGRASAGDDTDPKLGALANSPGREISLQEHLLNQWSLVEMPIAVRSAGEVIINQLDPDGYLRVPLNEIAARVEPPISLDLVRTALTEVQGLEPPGVGARDLVECLLLQVDALPGDNRVEREIVAKYLQDAAENRLPAMARASGYGIGEIQEALRVIRTMLHLHPGFQIGGRPAPAIRPDLIVDYADTGGGLTVRLARGNTPPLRVNEGVASMMKSKEVGKEEREFARKQVDAATAIIDAVRFRRERLLEVGRAIVEKQREFFDVGPEGLKVLRMTDLATEQNCDPSTISRTVSDKYMQTPRGIFPVRYFFTGGKETEEGESVGWDRVKARVRELVNAEDRSKPLRDEKIAEILLKEGLDISRRTVAKYRQQLNIPTARQRKQFE